MTALNHQTSELVNLNARGESSVSGRSPLERVSQLIETLFDGIARRVDAELGLAERLQREMAQEEARHQAAREQRQREYEAERDRIQSEYDRLCANAGMEYQAHYSAASEEYDEALRAANEEFEDASDDIRQKFEDARWIVVSYFDENANGSPKQQFEQFQHNIENSRRNLQEARTGLDEDDARVTEVLQKRRMWSEPPRLTPEPLPDSLEGLLESFDSNAEECRHQAAKLKHARLPAFFAGFVPAVVFLVTTVALTVTSYSFLDPAWLNFKTAPPMHEWLGILVGVSAVITLALQGILYGVARSATESSHERMLQHLTDARAAAMQWERLANRQLKKRRRKFDEWYAELVAERDSRLTSAQKQFDQALKERSSKRAAALKLANERYPALMENLTRQRDEKLQRAHDDYPGRLEKLKARFERDVKKFEEEHEKNVALIRQQYEFDFQNAARTWHGVIDTVRGTADRMQSEMARLSQAWPDLAFGNWGPPLTIPPGVRLGDFQLRLDDIEYGLPEDDLLMPEVCEFELPAMLPFPDHASLIMRAAGGEGRAAAEDLLRVAMLRLLTTLPPGKVRFTIVDPIGLGENFSVFMHLADFDELLVTNRIWTDPSHIEQRLADLTEHMETVFQTYLRNEFRTIEEYNEFAGEVAEPYRILIIAGFPAGFSEQAARRLTSIMTSGPRCGVYTLMSLDPQISLPPNFNLDDIAEEATGLTWSDGGFSFDHEEIAWLPFEPDSPPEPNEFSRIVKRVGDESKDARRVEVSFERVTPKELWQEDSSSGIDVPLGRAGATKLQHVRLGRGTSQHVLIAGKTGSGKSTFMHILVTNLSLHYSPDEIEFYLIDFKKGVEFKTYAANRLPHARVIAVESDREFGLSVLQRLDGLLKERGDLFRERGVQDIAAFRSENPERMPRIMLLIDEFQEFFTEDDRISQQAALLLDRLVRQGRAFGMHVMLGSQTLGGAYSLARSTLGQVAVRIALQCSDADAHLILSEDNTAARLLSRPGEAIYNDANGMLEGNHPFQIAWLDEDKREDHLQRIREKTRERGAEYPTPIVFEGNVPADVTSNHDLIGLFDRETPLSAASEDAPVTRGPSVVDAWLGEAVAIKPHTAVRFRRLSGANLLIVGQSPMGARGILASVFLAVVGQVPPFDADQSARGDRRMDEESETHAEQAAGQPAEQSAGQSTEQSADQPARGSNHAEALEAMKSFSFADMKIPRPLAGSSREDASGSDEDGGGAEGSSGPAGAAHIYVLDGELADAPVHELWSELAEGLPHRVRIGGPAAAPQFVSELAALIESRDGSTRDGSTRDGSTSEPPVFLLIDNLGRFRDLRKDDDDYSFTPESRKAPTPARRFVRILNDGPAVGVHTVVWCDTFNNAGRWMSSQTIRELEMRVAFQMSATDSSNFIDSPAASRLGQNRALLYLEETGEHEKFRPYGIPSDDVLDRVRRSFDHVSSQAEELTEEASTGAGTGNGTGDVEEDDIEVCDDLSSWTVL